jgi:predicted MFS family arabinose efflux permease
VAWLPVAYAAAMGLDGVVALVAGAAFDRSRRRGGTGALVLAGFVVVGAAYAPLVLAADAELPWLAIGGIAAWSIARAATESIGKSLIATIVPRDQRGRAYGVYYVVFGVAWLAGSVALGALYDRDLELTAIVAAGALVAGAAVIAASAYSQLSKVSLAQSQVPLE